MTDYAQAAAEPSWTWWMTTAAAAAAMRMQNLRDIRGGAASDDTDDEYGAPVGGKRQRIANVNDEYNNYWTGSMQNAANDSAAAGPLDLSVKATLTTTTTTTVINEREGTGDEKYTVKTPVKKSATDAGNGKSSKKSVASGGKTTSTAAMKAATRKLFPQLQQDSRVDRSSPVSGTIIVPAETVKQRSPSPGYSAVTSAANVDGRDSRDDDYDGDDIDPKFNVVVVTDEARRRLESIPNTLGPYLCRLCSVQYADAFALARHRCRCIVHVRYRCPECDKVFQCPANLASHRRWHGTATVKTSAAVKNNNNNSNNNNNNNKIPDVTPVAVETLQQPTKTTSGSRSINNNREDDDDGSTTTSTTAASSSSGAILSAAGFKKNILHRAVQAAAAAAKYDIVDAANDTPRYAIGVHTSTCN